VDPTYEEDMPAMPTTKRTTPPVSAAPSRYDEVKVIQKKVTVTETRERVELKKRTEDVRPTPGFDDGELG
jgi:hypothetical protein